MIGTPNDELRDELYTQNIDGGMSHEEAEAEALGMIPRSWWERLFKMHWVPPTLCQACRGIMEWDGPTLTCWHCDADEYESLGAVPVKPTEHPQDYGRFKLYFPTGDPVVRAMLVWDDHDFYFENLADGGRISDKPSRIVKDNHDLLHSTSGRCSVHTQE